MKSIHHGKSGANRKLHGKLSLSLPCKCCEMINWKWSERIKEANKEIRECFKLNEMRR